MKSFDKLEGLNIILSSLRGNNPEVLVSCWKILDIHGRNRLKRILPDIHPKCDCDGKVHLVTRIL
jgi:hypothetical protein